MLYVSGTQICCSALFCCCDQTCEYLGKLSWIGSAVFKEIVCTTVQLHNPPPCLRKLIKENLSLRWILFACSAWLQFNSSGTILASFLTANDVFVWQTHSTQSGGGECQKRKEATRPLGGDGNIANSCSWKRNEILTFILCCCVQSIKWSYKQWFSWLWIVDSFLHLAKILFELKKP